MPVPILQSIYQLSLLLVRSLLLLPLAFFIPLARFGDPLTGTLFPRIVKPMPGSFVQDTVSDLIERFVPIGREVDL